MSAIPSAPSETWDLIVEAQDGVVARRQLRDMHVSRAVVRANLRGRRWTRVYPGTYAVFTGPLPPRARIWAALLYAGPTSVASHRTAAWLHGLIDDLPSRIDVCVPHGHRHRASRSGVRVRQSRHVDVRRQPASLPPRISLEETVLDLTDACTRADDVISIVLAACQRRLTTAARIRMRARGRKRLRWRALLRDLLSDVDLGVQSALERRYRRDVERPHGLPRGAINAGDGPRGRRRYRDIRYRRWRLVVELDGRAAHPDDRREFDDLRDNEILEREGVRTLRYGWRSVAATPCRTAAQVGRALAADGWSGTLTACSDTCTVAEPPTSDRQRAT